VKVREALDQARKTLEPISDSPASDARLLLADSLGTTPTSVLANDGDDLPPRTASLFESRVRRCAAGEPLPYVLGWWEFYGRRFAVDRNVLIPRPETELLVEHTLAELRRRGEAVAARVAEVGTGSGCVAVTLAAEVPVCRVTATDVSRAALRVACANGEAHQVGARLQLVQTSFLDGLIGGWDVVCANLPYVPSHRLAGLPVARYEPPQALDGGPRGTELLERLIRSLSRHLAPEGVALLEMDEGQEEELAGVGREALGGGRFDVVPDLAGKPRLLIIRRGRDAG